MSLASCENCKKLFQKIRKAICPTCEAIEDGHYEIVRKYLSENPERNAEQVCADTGVPLESVIRFIEEGRIEVEGSGSKVVCGQCGEPAISSTKRLCKSCLEKLNAQLVREQSRIKLPEKKDLELNKAANSYRAAMKSTEDAGNRMIK